MSFGSVIAQSETVFRYVVQDLQDHKNLELICLLLNGNLIFPSRKEQFIKILDRYNSRTKKNIVLIEREAIHEQLMLGAHLDKHDRVKLIENAKLVNAD